MTGGTPGEPRWLTVRVVKAIHDRMLAEFGGLSGVRGELCKIRVNIGRSPVGTGGMDYSGDALCATTGSPSGGFKRVRGGKFFAATSFGGLFWRVVAMLRCAIIDDFESNRATSPIFARVQNY